MLVAVIRRALAVDHRSPTDTRRTEVNTTCLDDLGHVPRDHGVAPCRVLSIRDYRVMCLIYQSRHGATCAIGVFTCQALDVGEYGD